MIGSKLHAQTLNFATLVGGSSGEEVLSTCFDQDKNIIVAGKFRGNCDFDPSANDYILDAGGTSWTDAFIAKYDSTGSFLWAHGTGGTNDDEATSVAVDSQGNVIVCGYLNGNVDMDPGVIDTFTMASGFTNEYPFIQKFDPSGNLIWQKYFVTTSDNWGGDVDIDENENVIWGFHCDGFFTANINGNDSTFTSQSYYQDLFVMKISPTGTIEWCQQLAGTDTGRVWSVDTDNLNNIIIGGEYRGNMDFDPNIGTYFKNAPYMSDFCMKLNEFGEFDWMIRVADSISPASWSNKIFETQCLPNGDIIGLSNIEGHNVFKLASNGAVKWSIFNDNNNYSNHIYGMAVDSVGNVYSTYRFLDSTDVNPGTGINMKFSYGNCGVSATNVGIVLQKINPSGNFVWAKTIKNCGSRINDLDCYKDGTLTINGAISTGFDLTNLGGQEMTSSSGSGDFLISTISQDICSNLVINLDTITSLNCVDSAYFNISGTGGVVPYKYSFNNLPFDVNNTYYSSLSGINGLIIQDSVGCQNSTQVFLTAPTVPNGFDLDAHMITDSYRPGFTSVVSLDAFSDGCDLVSGQLKFTLDPQVSLISSSPTPSQTIGDTLIWSFTDLNYDSAHIVPNLILETSQSAIIGDTVRFDLRITPIQGDFDSTNNTKQYCFPVLNGYDPNDKKVYPTGVCEPGYIVNSQKLTYTVRFQNTGNSEAINIYLIDSLSDYLDLNTTRILASSDPMYTEVVPGNSLKFVFNNINLPDSSVSLEESQGYVIFEILPLPNLSYGDEILNDARIYFDFNPPILTNETKNTIFIGDLTNWECWMDIEEVVEKANFSVFPNPTRDMIHINSKVGNLDYNIIILDANGRKFESPTVKTNNQTSTIDISSFNRGVYFLQIQMDNIKEVIKIIKCN